jgi:hypothetical protein
MTEPSSYRLPDETLPSLGLADCLDDLLAMRDLLAGRGIPTRNTRIDRYIAYLQLACAAGPADAANQFKNSVDERFRSPTDWLLYVLREVHELIWIYKGISVAPPSGVDDKLKLIVSGSDFAALDRDSRSRDTQFELRVASYFCQAQCEVHLEQETDIVAVAGSKVFYLECKRVGSRKQLMKRIDEARGQLRRRMPSRIGRRPVYGCIALDVTKVAFAHNGLTWGLTSDHSRDVIQDKLREIGGELDDGTLFCQPKSLLFFWLQIHIPALIYHPPQNMTRFSSLQVIREVLERRERSAATTFYGIFERASKTMDPREAPPRKLVRRNGVTLPAGTTFGLNNRSVVMRVLEGEELSPGEEYGIVGTLSFDGKEHHFSAFDVRMLPSEVTEEWRNTTAATPEADLKLLLEMYLQRFPYRDD